MVLLFGNSLLQVHYNPLLVSYVCVCRLAEDPSVICVSSSTSTGQYRHSEQSQVDTPATSLEGPPGLKHPSSHDRSLESHDQLLMSSQDRSGESHDLSLESHDQRLPLSAPLSPQKENIEASTSEAASVLPEPIEMPSQQITSTVSTIVCVWVGVCVFISVFVSSS